jgi:chorismate mutase
MVNASLDHIRSELDAIDDTLVDLLVRRARLIDAVIAFKRSHRMAVVDRHREEEMLGRISQVAESRGLDPNIAREVLRAIINAFTLLEVEQLGDDA